MEGDPSGGKKEPFKGRRFFRMHEGHFTRLKDPLMIQGTRFRVLECIEEVQSIPGVGLYYKVRSTPEGGGETKEFYVRVFVGQIFHVERGSIPFPPKRD